MDVVRRLWDDCYKGISENCNALSRAKFTNRQQQNPHNSQQHNHQQHAPNNHPQQTSQQGQQQHKLYHNNNTDAANNKLEDDITTDREHFDSKYNALISDLGLDEKAKETLLGFTREKKVKLYRQISKTNERVSYYVEILENYSKATNQTHIDTKTDTLDRLRALLRSGRVSFVRDFLSEGGLSALLAVIQTLSKRYPYHRINEVAIGCLKNSMNCQEGRKMVLKSDRAVEVVAEMGISSLNRSEKARVVAISILSALCMVPGGHLKVLSAFNHLQNVASERCRFQSLIGDLSTTPSTHLTIAILVLINSLINYGPGLKQLEFRLHLRYEFLMLGLNAIIEKIQKSQNSLYDKHVEFYEVVRMKDEKEFFDKSSINKKRVDSKSVCALAEHLKQRHLLSPTYPHLLSILYHLVLIPHNLPWTLQQWKLIDKAAQELTIPQTEGEHKNGVGVKDILFKLSQEDGTKVIREKLNAREKELGEVKSLLDKKEKEVVLRAEEKNILLETLSELKTKLEVDALEHRRQLDGLSDQIKEFRITGGVLKENIIIKSDEGGGGGGDDEGGDDGGGDGGGDDDGGGGGDISIKNSSENIKKSGDADITNKYYEEITHISIDNNEDSSTNEGNQHHSINDISSDNSKRISLKEDLSLTIPLPPPLNGAPVPPPPPPPPLFNVSSKIPPKNIPQPTQPTKCFNWTKLQDHKIGQSIWKDLSDQEIYSLIDLEELERKFSAYQRSQQATQGSKTVVKELSLMDGRRSQNCNIMLTKLKMSNDRLIESIASGDPDESLSRDVCEQLLKFLPTTEESSLLKEHESESSQMAKPDLFLFRISQVDHYEQMLEGISFKKKYNERVSDLSNGMKAVLQASQVCINSTSFRRFLEIILAVGNFMNGSARGNASGFKLGSLCKLQDTKASDHKSSLLHYLAQLCDNQFPEMSSLDEDLASSRGASKVSLQEVDAELKTLRTGLKALEREAKYEEERKEGFSSGMKEFLQVATCRYDNLHELSVKMKKQYNEMLKHFCEESTVQPNECFKHIVALLDSLAEAKKENMAFKKQQEEEEAKALREAQMRTDRERKKYSSTTNMNNEDELGEFDAMIKTLMTGDAYDGTMGRGKRGNVRKLNMPVCDNFSDQDNENQVTYRRTKPSRSLANIIESRERIPI